MTVRLCVSILMVIAAAAFVGQQSDAKGPNRTAFDAVIAGGATIPPPGTAVTASYQAQIDWVNMENNAPMEAGLPQALAGNLEAYLFINSGLTLHPGPGMPGSAMTASALGARMGMYDIQRYMSLVYSPPYWQNLVQQPPHAGALPNCGDNDGVTTTRWYDPLRIKGEQWYHLQNIYPFALATMAGRDVIADGLHGAGWNASQYLANGGPLIQTFDDDNGNGLIDTREGGIAEPAFTRAGFYEHPYATLYPYYHYASPESQHDTDADGLANAVEAMPDFLPRLVEAAGLQPYWVQRGYSVMLTNLPYDVSQDLHLLGFNVPGVGAMSLFMFGSLAPPEPLAQSISFCTPANMIIQLDAITSAAPLCTLTNGEPCYPPPSLTDLGDAVASISSPGAHTAAFYMSDTDDYDADGMVTFVDICNRGADNSDPDGDIVAGACDANPASWDNDGDGDATTADRAMSLRSLVGFLEPLASCKTTGNGICDNDSDGDNWIENIDVCETVYDPDQRDSDGDGVGDACEGFTLTGGSFFAGKGAGTGAATSANIDNDLLCVETWSVGGTEPAGDGIAAGGCTEIDDANDNAIADADDTASDSDGDAFSDALETQFGSNLLDPAAIPLACLVAPPSPLDADADYLRDECDPDDAEPDCDDDGVLDGIEQGARTIRCTGAYPAGADTDGDGCLNEVELAADPLRHPGNWWDNYDVTGSGDIDLADALAVLQVFGEFDQQRDRRRLLSPGPPALLVEANDGIDLSEALANLAQFGWAGCSAPGATPPQGGGRY